MLKLRATPPQGAVSLNDSSCASAPASFKAHVRRRDQLVTEHLQLAQSHQ